jgi:hypothetical protein
MSLTVDFPMPIDPVNPIRFGLVVDDAFVIVVVVVVVVVVLRDDLVRVRCRARWTATVVVRWVDSARMRVHRARAATTFEDALNASSRVRARRC